MHAHCLGVGGGGGGGRLPRLPPRILNSSTWDLCRDLEKEIDEEDLTKKVDISEFQKSKIAHMSRGTFITKSQAEMHAEADNMIWGEMMKENQTMVNPSETIAANENAVVVALCLMTAKCKEESVNMVQGWRRAEQVWAPVWSAMDNECGVGVVPPGMCSTCPITGSQWSRGGRESTSTSEDTVPKLDQQHLGVVLDTGSETTLQ